MQTPTQGRSPRFCVAKPLKGFAPLLFRECLRLSLAREECVHLGWGGHNPNATFQCVAYTLHPVSDEISHFSRQTEMPLNGRSLFTEQTTPCSTVFLGTHTLYATRQTLTATNRPIVRTPNLNATSFGRPFLWEVVDCHFTLPLCSCRVGFSPPTFYLRCWLTSATIRK